MQTDIPPTTWRPLMMNTARDCRGEVSAPGRSNGLGSANQNMPGFISLRPSGGFARPGGSLNWGSGLPARRHAGDVPSTRASPTVDGMIPNIRNEYFGRDEQRRELDLVQQLNTAYSQNCSRISATRGAHSSPSKMAYRMQIEATDAFDLSKEPESVAQLVRSTRRKGRQLLIARLLIERGVRFIQSGPAAGIITRTSKTGCDERGEN